MLKKITYFLILISTLCSCQRGDITSDMKQGLISFEQKNPKGGMSEIFDGTHYRGELIIQEHENQINIKYYTVETGLPTFDGGFKVINDSLYLYYQDINSQAVSLEELYLLEYQIERKHLAFKEVKVSRLPPVVN